MTNKVYVAFDGTEFGTKQALMEYHDLLKLGDEAFAEKRKQYLVLKETQAKACLDVFKFREQCEHEYVKIKACSDTGNYDRSQDSYWYEIECKCCEDRWNEDQSTSKYKTSDRNTEWIR